MRKKILLTAGIILFLIAAFLLTAFWFMLEEKADIPSAPQDFPAVLTGMRKLNYHLRTASSASAGETKHLILTESEFNMLMSSIVTNPFLFSLTGNQIPDFLRLSRITARNGILYVHYAHDTGRKTVFGRYINFRIRMRASAAKGIFSFRILSCRAGPVSVPSMLAEKILAAAMRKQYDNTPADKILRGGYLFLDFRNDALSLKYQPKELIDSADLALYGSVNNRVRKAAESFGKRKR